jgi:hypothetical protein
MGKLGPKGCCACEDEWMDGWMDGWMGGYNNEDKEDDMMMIWWRGQRKREVRTGRVGRERGLDWTGLEERERLGLDRSGERKAWAWTGRAWKAGAGVYKQAKGREGSVSRSVSQSESVSRVTMMRAMVISVERERERESTGGFDA